MSEEQWAPVVGFNGRYEVSSLGRVCSLLPKTRTRCPSGEAGNYLSVTLINGYPQVRLTKPGHNRGHYVHRLVLEAFVGTCPIGSECRHLDGNRKNSILANLQWGTVKENRADAIRHGTQVRGERCGTSKLKTAQVRRIKQAIANGLSCERIAKEYGVVEGTIRWIARGLTWAHI
jgi:hypothetical protein